MAPLTRVQAVEEPLWHEAELQARVAEMLAQGHLPPGEAGPVEVHETHISYVFLTAHSAYKLKKAVRFPFVDFSTLEKRHQACQAEVELNRRLAPEVYLGVIPVYWRHGKITFSGRPEQVVDYLVHMRRLPQERMLDHRILRARVLPEQLQELTELLARFYRHLAPCMLRPEEYLQRFWHLVLDNGRTLRPRLQGRRRWMLQGVQTTQRLFLRAAEEQLRRRVCDGRIVQGHGDLRPEHICLTRPPVVFDCVEFSQQLRQVDVADELAFLEVECAVLGAEELGRKVRTECLRACGDFPSEKLVEFYKSYRACVRAKVAALQLDQHPHDEKLQRRMHNYLEAAWQCARRITPVLVLVVRGKSGSGKSTLAQALASELALPWLSTDQVRVELFGTPGSGFQWNQGLYAPENRRRVYQELLRRTAELLDKGSGAVLDGTFLEPDVVNQLWQLVRRYSAQAVALECRCPEPTAQQRIAQRSSQGGSLSQAPAEAPWRQPQPAPVPFASFVVDTSVPFAQEMQTTWAHLASVLKLG